MTSNEDAYSFENMMHGMSRNESELFDRSYYRPLLVAFHDACKALGVDSAGMQEYMIAKHGLERNVVLAERDAQSAYDKYQKAHPQGKKTLQDFVDEFRGRDYSGLTSLVEETQDIVDARRYVAQVEAVARQKTSVNNC